MFVHELDTPSVIVDLDVLELNLRRMSEYCRLHDIKLRPHIKTHKIIELARRQVDNGAAGVTVAKLGEAEVMISAGFHDLLIAYPIVTDSKAIELCALAEKAKIAVSLDSLEAIDVIARRAEERGVTIGVLTEVDIGFHRCGVSDGAAAVALAQKALDSPGLEFLGLMFYPGHLMVPAADQTQAIKGVNGSLSRFYEAFDRSGVGISVVSGGSTPTSFRSHEFTGVTEIRPGMYLFNDRNLLDIGVATISDCALSVIVTVVSVAVSGRAIIDGGSKTFSSDLHLTGDKEGFGLVKEDLIARFFTMAEEHGYLDISKSARPYSVGERLTVIPNHVCTTINMHDEIYGVRNGVVEEVWRVKARGKVR